MCALLYDNRNLGASDGEPRQEIDPWAQVRDFRDAISYARTRDEVDGDKIGLWGSSYSGAHAIVVGALDRRVKCVVSQVPLISGHAQRAPTGPRRHDRRGAGDVRRRPRGPLRRRGRRRMIAAVAPEGEPCAMPTPDSYEWFTSTGESRAPAWRNEVTLRSVEMFWEYEPGAYLPYVSPTPLLMVVAAGDHLTVSDVAIDAFERAREPKRLEILAGGHFDAYVADFEASQQRRAGLVRRSTWPRGSRRSRELNQRGQTPLGAPAHVARQRQAVRAGRAHQREAGGDPRARTAAADLEPVGEVAHQRQAEPDAGAVDARAHAEAVVVHGDLHAVVVQAGRHVDAAGLAPGRGTRAAQHS